VIATCDSGVLRTSGACTSGPAGPGTSPRSTIPLQPADAWLDHFRRFWDQRLDALGTEIGRGE
jgi:hypothetical protein